MTAEQPLSSRAPKRRTRRRWIVGVLVAAVLLAGAGTAWALTRPRVASVGVGDTTVLTEGTLVNGISATGIVSAATSAKVHSTLTYPVTLVHAEVGQEVNTGDLLAQLDPTAVDELIASKRASMTQAQATAAAALAAAQNKYRASAGALREGTNAGIVNAESSASAAYETWQKAVRTAEDFGTTLGNGENAQLVTAQTAVDNAEANERNAGYSVKQARDAWEAAAKPDYPDPTRVALDQAVLALDAARTARRNAEDAYDAAATSADTTLSDHQAAAEQAHEAYLNAQRGVAAAEASAQTELQGSRDAVKSSQASSRQDAAVADLAGLLTDRESTTITAPISGTVTAVNAVVGAPAAGVLFVVETPDRLEVASSVNEYDVNTVQPGMPVRITSDATRDVVHEGTLRSIAPASTKDPEGESVAGSDIQYATEIDVISTGTGLRIGMNARVQYVVAEERNVLSVPLDAVFTDAQGRPAVLALAERPDGNYVVEEVPVTLGLETDIDVVVSGDGVRAGLRVLNTPASHRAGSVVSLSGL